MNSHTFFATAKQHVISLQALFYFGALLFLILEIYWIIGSFSFLMSGLDRVFIYQPQIEATLKFDIKGFESLNLIRN